MSKKTFLILLGLVIFTNFTGLLCDIFMQDSSLYAAISKSLSVSGNYWDIYVNGKDWLDKPHFPFWVCGLFIKILGANTFGYKLPSLIFFVIGMMYTYKLAKKLYNIQVARLAILILGSSIHIMLSNNDVRAEAILLGLVMGAMYHLYKLNLTFSIRDLLLGAIFSAAAVMTKGVFVLIIFYSAFFLNMIVSKKYNEIKNIKWVLVLLLTILFIAPEIYALYNQFDLFPEKKIFGRHNVSGVKFFLWDSQFGRFFNTGPIKGKGDVLFFIHGMLWAFAPWSVMGFYVLFITSKQLWKKVYTREYITFFGFSVMFIIFSLSSFQLPHYTNILFPLISIMVANFIINHKDNLTNRILRISINVYSIVFTAVIILLEYFFRTGRELIALTIVLIIIILFVYTNSKKVKYNYKYPVLGILSSLLLFLYLNLCFYPKLEKYQAGSQISFYLNKHYPNKDVVVSFNDWLLQYYFKKDLLYVKTINELKREILTEDKVLIANENFLKKIKESSLDFEIVKTFNRFTTTRLNKNFINYKTRNEVIDKCYLIKVKAIASKTYKQ